MMLKGILCEYNYCVTVPFANMPSHLVTALTVGYPDSILIFVIILYSKLCTVELALHSTVLTSITVSAAVAGSSVSTRKNLL